MASKTKAKRRGRPRLAKEARREVRSVRLPAALWARIEARGNNTTSIIEEALLEWLGDTDNQKGDV